MALPFGGLLGGTGIRSALGRAATGLRTTFFGTPARAGATGTIAGIEIAGIVPDGIADRTPGGARTVIFAAAAAAGAWLLSEAND